MATETIGCSLELCQCMVSAELDDGTTDPQPAYCSDTCREASEGEEEEMCACGHPSCDTP